MPNVVLDKDVFGIHVAGIGPTDNTASNAREGWMWCSDASMVGTNESNYVWRPDLIVNEQLPLQSLSTLIEPFENRQRYSAFDFVFPATDEVTELVMYRQVTAPYELTSTLEPSVTTVDLDTTGLDDTIVFLHGETILLGTDDGSGSYSGSTRKYFGSPEQYHGVGTNVYTKPPFWSGRVVTLFTYETDGTLTQRWRGRIDGSIEMDRSLITVPCSEQLGGIKSLRVGRGLDVVRNQTWTWTAQYDSEQRYPQNIEFEMDTQITKPEASAPTEPYYYTALQIGEILMRGQVENSTYPGTQQSVRSTHVRGGTPFLHSGGNVDNDTELGEQASGDVREVFMIDRYALFTAGQHLSSTYKLANVTYDYADKYPYHPLAIFGALTLSTDDPFADPDSFDVLQGTFSAKLKDQFSSDIITTLHDEIQENPDLQVDQMLLAWDGDEVEVLDVCLRLLQAYGYYLGITNEGKMQLQRIRLPDIEDYDNGLSNVLQPVESNLLVLGDGQDKVADVVQAELGGLPYRGSKSLFVQGLDGAPRRAAELNNEPDFEIDMSFLARDAQNQAISILESRSLIQGRAYPRLRIRVNDWRPDGLDYSLGSVIFLDDLPVEKAWLIDAAGNRVRSVDTGVQWAGFIVGRRFLPMQGLAYEIDLLLTGDDLVRWRAPSGIIQSLTDGSGGNGGDRIVLGTTSSFGDTISDPNRFEEGDEIRLYFEDGTPHNGGNIVYEIIQDGVDYIDVDKSVATFPDSPVGAIVELAHLDTDGAGTGYENVGLNGTFTNVERAYAFLADDQNTLGDDEEDADSIG